MSDLLKVVEALKARGFEADFAPTKAAALAIVLDEVNRVSSVGWGGSETLKEIGAREAISAMAKDIRDHQLDCELFLCSANALTADGRLVNIDGTGNRVAATIFGPKRVVYVIGRNKIVEGGIDDAIARIKRSACPPNARRLGRATPCALTGVCADCDRPDRMCKVISIHERKPNGLSARVVLVNEELGY